MARPKIEIEVSARGVRTVQQRLQGLLGGVKSWALGVGGALAAALGTREVLRQLDGAVDAIDKIGADAQRVGVLPETLSTLGHAAALSKSNSDELQKSLEKLGRSISEAGDGVVTYTDAFSKLGVEVRNTDGTMRSTGEVFFDLADAFQKLPDGPQKTALAMDLLGKSGAKLIPMLNQGSAAIHEMQEEARAFGLEVDGNAAKAAGDFNDNLDRLKAAAKGLWQTVAQDLLPILVQLTKQVVQSVKEGGALLTLAHGIASVLKTIIRLSIQTWEGLKLMAAGWDIITDWLSLVLLLLARLLEAWDTFAFRLKLNIGAIIIALTGLGEVFDLVLDRKFARAAARMKEVMVDLAKATADLTQDAAKDLKAFGDAFTEAGDYAAETAAESGRKWDAAVVKAGQRLLTLDQADEAGMTPFELPAQPAPVVIESETVIRQRTKLELEQRAQALADARLNLSARAARVENDRWLSDTQRYRTTLTLKRWELSLLDDYIMRLKERAEIEEDEATRALIASQLRSAERERVGLDTQVVNFEAQGDPASMTAQLFNAADDIARRIGTLAQQVARSFTDVIGSAIDGISGAIEGLIKGTMTWRDALANVARTIGNSVISAVSRMFAEWITKRLMLMAKNIFAAQAEGAAETAAKTPGAVLTSISSFGVAAVVGLAAVMAALAAVGGFETGGAVRGPGGPKSDSILARLSNGEFVLNADAVRHYGQPTLEAMNRRMVAVQEGQAGARQPVVPAVSSVPAQAAPEAARQALNLVLVDRRNQAREFIESSEGEARILDIIRRRRIEIG